MSSRQPTPSVLLGPVALGVVILLGLSGCEGAGGDPSPEVDEATAEVVATDEGTSPAGESDAGLPDGMVTPRPGMVDARPVSVWHEYGSWDGELMYVTFPSQGEPCEVLDRIEVDETDTRVTVTLYQGRDPDIDPDEPCDGPLRTLGVVLPPLERDYGAEEGAFVNGASPTGRP